MERPTKPKAEKPAVTIANLERENDNLCARIEKMAKRNSELEHERNEWRRGAEDRLGNLMNQQNITSALHSQLEEAQAKIAKLESVLCGYRAAIADVYGHKIENPE